MWAAVCQDARPLTAVLDVARNRVVCALAERILVIYAAPGGKLERACAEFVGWGRPVLALRSPHNQHLLALGVRWLE